MNETIVQYKDRLLQYWKQASKMQKYMIIGTVVFLIAVLVLTSINLSKTEYAPAFTSLQPNDAAGIKEYLDGAKIPYKLSADGKTISVPTSQAASVKLDVESKGLNKGGSLGYAGMFPSNSMFGMSDSQLQIKKLSAMQGEIQMMFNQISGVGNSKVLITVPDESKFITTNVEQSKASVVLTLLPGYRYDQAQIDTMYNLVAKTVPNLKHENITISNQNFEPMEYSKSASISNLNGDLADKQFAIKNRFQADIQKNITNLLNKIVGPDKVVVSVVSNLNFDQVKTATQTFQPVNPTETLGIPRSSQTNTKSSATKGTTTGGIPGTGTTDVPTYQANSASGGNSESEERNEIINYEINEIKSDIVASPYVVKDLSISVGIEPPVRDDPNSLSQEMRTYLQQALESIVATSLADSGTTFTPEQLTRKVTLFVQPFAGVGTVSTGGISSYWMYGAIGAAALLAAGLGGYMMRRRRLNAMIEEEIPAPPVVELPTIDIENVSPENQMRKQLESLAKKKPEDFVNLLRTWLVDE
ncbi:flagellar basal-body MS-ring/collar protein FliF [Paenibacillus koleovorans]|uniref:flagellar basal-body MS-ring/collar protein FliF n=1 Tax=Paenibacillus koleovorans TaxID=121608 RepID=UPI000FD90855|nr:flagellar basal-body MS-ring/collar protein FliF [Paenibacillus koleovorans]